MNPVPSPRKQTIRLSELLKRVKHPCEAGCFLQSMTAEVLPRWSEDAINSFKSIYHIEPDMIPCDHAELCFKPCHEVRWHENDERFLLVWLQFRSFIIADYCIQILTSFKLRAPMGNTRGSHDRWNFEVGTSTCGNVLLHRRFTRDRCWPAQVHTVCTLIA